MFTRSEQSFMRTEMQQSYREKVICGVDEIKLLKKILANRKKYQRAVDHAKADPFRTIIGTDNL